MSAGATIPAWQRFHDYVLSRPELFEQLREITSEADFIAACMRVAGEQALELCEADVKQGLNQRRRDWIERSIR